MRPAPPVTDSEARRRTVLQASDCWTELVLDSLDSLDLTRWDGKGPHHYVCIQVGCSGGFVALTGSPAGDSTDVQLQMQLGIPHWLQVPARG